MRGAPDALTAEQRAEEERRKPRRLGLPPPRIGRVQLRLEGEEVRPALQQRCGLTWLSSRHGGLPVPRHHTPGIERLISDQHCDAMARDGRERFERWDRGPRS